MICLFTVHSTLLSIAFPALRAVLFSYVNTMFMFIAGYLCNKSISSSSFSFRHFWLNKLRTIVWPFILCMTISYIVAGVAIGPQFLWSIASYSLGLRVFTQPIFYGLDFWFVSVLISYFLIFSIFGKRQFLVLIVSTVIVLLGFYYFVTVPANNVQLLPNFFLYLIPFALGYAWKMKFTDNRVLITLPIIVPLALNITPIDLNLWNNVFMLTEQMQVLILSICLTLLLLYCFNRITSKTILKATEYVGSSSLVIYMLEPLISVLTLWVLFPGYIGNIDTGALLLSLSPLDSLKRIPVSIVTAFILCPIILKTMGKGLGSLGRAFNYMKKQLHLHLTRLGFAHRSFKSNNTTVTD